MSRNATPDHLPRSRRRRPQAGLWPKPTATIAHKTREKSCRPNLLRALARSIIHVVCITMAVTTACSDSGTTPPAGPALVENVGAKKDKFSNLGIERVVPLRFVQVAENCKQPRPCPCQTCSTANCGTVCTGYPTCSPCSDEDPGNPSTWTCGPDTTTYDNIRARVEHLNWAYKVAGVQFYTRSIEKYSMPSFFNLPPDDNPYQSPWCADPVNGPCIRNELRRPYPNMPTWAWNDGDQLRTVRWLYAVPIRYGEMREAIVWVTNCSIGWDGPYPSRGASMLKMDTEGMMISLATVHETGHMLGLPHSFDVVGNAPTDPEQASDTAKLPMSGYWDLIYKPKPNPPGNDYFTSQSAAHDAGCDQTPSPCKHKDPDVVCGPHTDCCEVDTGTCTMTCWMNGQQQTFGSPGMEGMDFGFIGDNPPTTYVRGWQPMTYISLSAACPWTSLSNSQTQQVHRMIRYDVRIDQSLSDAPKSLGYTGRRPYLGQWRDRAPADKLDFDSDGRRDIGIWQPPVPPATTGTFTVLLSSAGYSTGSPLVGQLGRMGDVPVPADYDGDGKTDMAVWHIGPSATTEDPYSPYAWWRWCPSYPVHSCGLAASQQWGLRGDLPLAGHQFYLGATGSNELAVYRLSEKAVHWQEATSWWNWGSIYLNDVGDPFFPAMGLYNDGDAKTDIAGYEPHTGHFYLYTSATGWAFASRIDRLFPSDLVPDAVGASDAGAGAPAARAGGIVSLGADSLYGGTTLRRDLQVWDANTGNWYTNRDPVSSSAITSCQWGMTGDIPVAGFIDRDGDARSDMIIWRSSASGGAGGWLYFLNSNGCWPYWGLWVASGQPHSVISVVQDMNGDGKQDILLYDPEKFVWTRIYSNPGDSFYTVQPDITFGAPGAMAL